MITLYELMGAEDRRYSSFSWRIRMALLHKGLAFETVPILMSDKETIAFSGGKTVPILKDGEAMVRDSWDIAVYLENAYPDRRSLFGGAIGQGVTRVFNAWVDRVVMGALLPVIVADIVERVHPDDHDYVLGQMRRFTGGEPAEVQAKREKTLPAFRATLAAIRSTLKRQPFVCGDAPAYADYILFSAFQWGRVMSPCALLEADDSMNAWVEAMLDLHENHARSHTPA